MAELLLTQVLNGITVGLILALVALGLTLVMGLMEVVNFAHGSFYMLGGYITFTVTALTGNFWVGLMAAVAVAGLVGLGLFWSLIKPLRNAPPSEPMVALVGVSLIFRQATRNIWGADPKLLPIPFGKVHLQLFGWDLVYPVYFLVVIGLSILLLVGFYLLLHKTDIGVRCLAAIQDREIAQAHGVNVNWIGSFVFMVSMAVAGVAGGIVGPIFSVYPTMGIEFIGLLFVVAILGGVGSIGGAVLAGLTIALTRSISSLYVSGSVSEILAYCILLVILMVRPRGLMGLSRVLE